MIWRIIYYNLRLIEEFDVHDTLSNKLAWRDFRQDHSSEEINQMKKENGGYFGVSLYDYEKKYWDEFEMRRRNWWWWNGSR